MRGKKTDAETVADVLTESMRCTTTAEAARRAGVPRTTAVGIIDRYMSDDEFVEARREKLKELSDKMLTALIDKMPEASFKDISTAFGIVTDKAILLDGGATQRIEMTADVSTDKLAELAGYRRDG